MLVGCFFFFFSQLLFDDDILIFCGAHTAHLCHLHCLFLCFEATLGLKINFAELKLVPMRNVEHVERLAGILDCGFLLYW
jgi:hypothetical protein